MLSFFPRDVLDEILNLIESVSEGFPFYSSIRNTASVGLVVSEEKMFENVDDGRTTDDERTTNAWLN